MSENNLTHFDAAGNAVMVDVSEKPVTAREATAHGIITMNADAFAAVESGTVKKGDVLGVARVAGIRPKPHAFSNEQVQGGIVVPLGIPVRHLSMRGAEVSRARRMKLLNGNRIRFARKHYGLLFSLFLRMVWAGANMRNR